MVWDLKRFGDVCDFVRGPFGGSLKKSIFKPDGHAVYEQQHAIYNQFEDIRYFIDKEKFSEMSRFELKPNDLIMSCSGTMGKIAIVPNGIKQGIINQALLKLTPKDTLLPVFLKLWMDSPNFQQQIEAMSQGAAIKNMASVKILKEIKVPVPKVSEQQRIVAILDQAFADIEKARANAEKNLKNARELFDSYLNQVFSQRGEGWVERLMPDICEITSSLVDPREQKYLVYPHVGAGNIASKTGALLNVKSAEEEGLVSGKFVFDSSMVLYSKIRPYLMKVCRPDFEGLCSADIYPLKPNAEIINRDFLFYMLLTDVFTSYAIAGSARAGMPKVNRTHLFDFAVWLPSVDEQKQFVDQLNVSAEQTRKLKAIYEQKLASLDELKKSLLQKAFSGELTKTEGHAA
jgi:type I restriction enzyme S subunit